MSRLFAIAATIALLALGGCGGDDETAADGGTIGATGAQDVAGGEFMTAGEFIDASIPDQAEEVETIAGITPDCEGVEVNEDFQVGVAINAAQAAPGTPLEEIVADQCES